jgi:hypothetical protein
MDSNTKENVVKWMVHKYGIHKVPLSYEVLKEAMKIYGITFEDAYDCKMTSFKRVLGMGNKGVKNERNY